MPRCALGGQRVGSAPPTATNRHPRAAAGCCEIDRRLKRSPRYPAIWREYPSWRVNGAEGKGVDQAWNIGRWKRLPGLVAWAIGSYDPLQVVRCTMSVLALTVALAVSHSADTFARVELACPAFVQSRQELVSQHEGWSVGPSRLDLTDGVLRHPGGPSGFSSGPAQNAVFLVPGENGWTVPEGGDIWLNCTYYGTKIMLSRRVPKGSTLCQIDVDSQTKKRTAWCSVRT